MFANILRSLSGTLSSEWLPTGDRKQTLRLGLEKTMLFVLCSAGLLGLSSLTLGISQQTVYCDRGLAFWNGFAGVMLVILASACALALFSDTKVVDLATSIVWDDKGVSLFSQGPCAFNALVAMTACPLALIGWIARGAVDVTSSPTCRSTAALLYGGTILNITLIISALSFAVVMATYFMAASKGFYDIAVLACVCDPIGVVVDGVSEKIPAVPSMKIQEICGIRIPSFNELISMLPTYEKTKAVVKRIVETVSPSALPEKFNALMDTQVY